MLLRGSGCLLGKQHDAKAPMKDASSLAPPAGGTEAVEGCSEGRTVLQEAGQGFHQAPQARPAAVDAPV